MKKFFVGVMALIMGVFFVGCGKVDNWKPTDIDDLSEEITLQIKQDFLVANELNNDQVNNVWMKYLGTYQENIAVMIYISEDGYLTIPDVLWEVNIAGVQFNVYIQQHIKIWRDGNFLNLYEAYDNGDLGKNDIRNIKWHLEVEK